MGARKAALPRPRQRLGAEGNVSIADRTSSIANPSSQSPEGISIRRPQVSASVATPRAIPPCSMKHLRRDAVWRGNGLCLGRRVIAIIVPDSIWPKMWRVKVGDRLTDMVGREMPHCHWRREVPRHEVVSLASGRAQASHLQTFAFRRRCISPVDRRVHDQSRTIARR